MCNERERLGAAKQYIENVFSLTAHKNKHKMLPNLQPNGGVLSNESMESIDLGHVTHSFTEP